MLQSVVLLNLFIYILCSNSIETARKSVGSNLEARLIAELTNDTNLDLSEDTEYEDLRVELLAYHTALDSLSETKSRRSMLSTPCWSLGGICVRDKLCSGFRSLSEVAGCRDKSNVCCFVQNKFNVRDMREHGIKNLAMPWSLTQEVGGKGVIIKNPPKTKKKKRKHKVMGTSVKKLTEDSDKPVAYIIQANK